MTTDDRLDRLTERHEALAESLQLLTADVQSLAHSTKELKEITKELDRILRGHANLAADLVKIAPRTSHRGASHRACGRSLKLTPAFPLHRSTPLGRLLLAGSFLRKHPRKNLIDILKLPLQIKRPFNLSPRNPPADFPIVQNQFAEIQILSPGSHRMALHQSVRVLARNPALHQVEQQLPAENQALRALQIRQHAFRINEHGLNQIGRLIQQIVS